MIVGGNQERDARLPAAVRLVLYLVVFIQFRLSQEQLRQKAFLIHISWHYMHSISLCALDEDILRVRDDPLLVSPKTFGCMQQMSPFLPHIRRKTNGCYRNAPVTDEYWVFKLFRKGECNGRRKG